MNKSPTPKQAAHQRNPLRIWPAVLILLVTWSSALLPPVLMTFGKTWFVVLVVGVAGSQALYFVWWIFFSRIPWRDRFWGIGLLLGGIGLGCLTVFHHSTYGLMNVPTVAFFLPAVLTAVTAAMLLTKWLPWEESRWFTAVWLLIALAGWASVRMDGSTGGLQAQITPRWRMSDEEQFLAQRAAGITKPPGDAKRDIAKKVNLRPGDWPGFRGPGRDSKAVGVVFTKDWNVHPPREIWRKRVGPGWSSFAVVDGRLYTYEQRGIVEAVVCYDSESGDELWANGPEDEDRFYRFECGYGPLSTPTFYQGAIYACGAKGVVQKLDAATGELAWRRELKQDLGVAEPMWGFSTSPLVVEAGDTTLVIVFASNTKQVKSAGTPPNNESTIAYNAETGEPVWTAGEGMHSYASPMLATLGGAEQVLVTSEMGLESLDPATGERLWYHESEIEGMNRTALPIIIDESTLVLAGGYGYGAELLKILNNENEWTVEPGWQTKKLRPYFNDCVFHEGHIYGFDDRVFTCLDAKTGEVTWPKRTRRKTKFGCGQVLLLADMDLLLVVTEETGEVVLLETNPAEPIELARLPVLEGKTWNHPVIAHGRLYVRNGAQAVCFELPTMNVAGRPSGQISLTRSR